MARRTGAQGSAGAAARAAERAREQAARQAERARKAQERERAQAEAAARDAEAEAKTRELEARLDQLRNLLSSSLHYDPRVNLEALRQRPRIPPLNLAHLAEQPPPMWENFQPRPPGALSRLFGGVRRYHDEIERARRLFAEATSAHELAEREKHEKRREALRLHEEKVAAEMRRVAAYNEELDKISVGLQNGERHAVSKYFDLVLRRSPYPSDFPNERRAGYVPESSLLAIEWYLPPVEAIPGVKAFRHVKSRKVVESTPRPQGDIAKLYQEVIAQIALRTLREVFAADMNGLIDTVVFNGRVRAVEPTTRVSRPNRSASDSPSRTACVHAARPRCRAVPRSPRSSR